MTKNRLKTGLPILLLLTGIGTAWDIMASRPRVIMQLPEAEVPLVTVIQVEPQTLRLTCSFSGHRYAAE